jgi:hypothetical protein
VADTPRPGIGGAGSLLGMEAVGLFCSSKIAAPIKLVTPGACRCPRRVRAISSQQQKAPHSTSGAAREPMPCDPQALNALTEDAANYRGRT